MTQAAQWAAWEAARAGPPPLVATPAALPAPESLPPRAWLYGTALIRRFVSLLVAPGGVGKSALALGQALALASGRPFLAERVHHSVPAWVLNLEDPLEETERRVAALMARHGIAAPALAGRLFLDSGRKRRLCMACHGPEGRAIVHPDEAALVEAARAAGVGLIVVDPFVRSHALDENSNQEMDAAAAAWARVAEATAAAVLLVHHVRKGAAEAESEVEAARGAKALTDAARVARLLSAMTTSEAEKLGVDPRERHRFIRLDDAKANLAPRAEAALWFRLDSVNLNNATPLYPAGDAVAVVVPWTPPSPFAALDDAACNRVLDAIAAGPEPGVRYTAQRRGRGASGGRWAGALLVREHGLSEGQADTVLTTWLKSGLLVEADYRDPVQRRARRGLSVNETLRPGARRGNGQGDGA